MVNVYGTLFTKVLFLVFSLLMRITGKPNLKLARRITFLLRVLWNMPVWIFVVSSWYVIYTVWSGGIFYSVY